MPEETKEKKGQSAKEVAEIMAANMAANMKDPEKFWEEHDRIREEATHKVLEERRKRKLKEQEEEEKL